jgi:YgiT-type zinc finger domain-containing protein
MKCSVASCGGEYEQKHVIHTVRSGDRVLVIDHVPAEVCSLCGDVLFTPQTVRQIERLVADPPETTHTVPLLEYASASAGTHENGDN